MRCCRRPPSVARQVLISRATPAGGPTITHWWLATAATEITKQRMRIEKMRFLFGKCLVIGALSMMAMGCEPKPVVVNPDDDDAIIVEEEDDTVVVPDTNATPPADNDGVNVDVGPGGVDVDVNRDAPSDANQNPNP
jgi:hypothetical protein